VSDLLSDSLPWTIILVGITTIVGFAIGTGLGVVAGWKRGSWVDGLLPVTTFLSSIPYFWLGLIALALLAGPGSFFPSSGGYDPGVVPGWDGGFIGSAIQHSLLPALTILISSMGSWILGMRNMMVTVASEDYVTVAHAKGLPERRVMVGYAARNALLPSVSGFALALGFIVGGTLLVEIVFSYPGVGFQLFQAVGSQDYPLMQGIFLIITLSVLVANLFADVAYLALDPRTRKEG
jgi:peptide/nickel transport system permease protein